MYNYDGCVNLAIGIIDRACEDYKKALIKSTTKDTAQFEVLKINRFFKSKNYDNLTSVDGEWLRQKMRQAVIKNEDIKDEKKRKKKEDRVIMEVQYDREAYTITKAHKQDAGIDIRAKYDQTVKAHGSAIFHTGVHVAIPKGCGGLLVSKSGLNVNHDIISDGLIDEGYTGEIVVKLYNLGKTDYKVKAGDKISQLVIIPVVNVLIEPVEELEQNTARGNGGFGSSGR